MNLSEEIYRRSLAATTVTTGSAAQTTAAALLSDAVTAFTGGIVLTNCDATITIWISTALDGSGAVVAGVNDVGSWPLFATQSIRLAMADLKKISAIAASGTPRLAWVGTTL